MQQQANILQGVIPAIITPMDERGTIDFDALAAQAAYLSAGGVHGFFVGGTTAEGAYLSTEELRSCFQVVREASGGRQFLCLASLRPCTRMVLEGMEALADVEPDYVVVVAPYYLSVSQTDILAHYRAVLSAAPAPVIVYNIPGTTHNPISLETVFTLAAEPRVAGTKDSSGDFITFSRGVLESSDTGFSWIQGEDYLHGPSLCLGAQGIVSGLCNVQVRPYVEMYEAAGKGQWERVNDLQAHINRLYGVIHSCGGRTIAAIKAAVHLQGRAGPGLRQRSMGASPEELEGIRAVLQGLELL